MANYRADAFWPWLRFEPLEGPPSLGLDVNGTGPMGIRLMAGAYDPAGQAAVPAPGGNEPGLSNWRPANANPFVQSVMPPTGPRPEPQPSWFGPQGNDELVRPELKWPWLRVEPPNGSPGLRVSSKGVRVMAGAYDPASQAAVPAAGGNEVGLSSWRPPNGNPFGQFVTPQAPPESQASWFGPQGNDEAVRPELKWPWLRVESEREPSAPDGSIASAPTGNANAFGSSWRSQDFGRAGPFSSDQLAPFVGQPSEVSETQPWWSRIPAQDEGHGNHPEPRWSWLRAEPEDEVPGFRLNQDGSIKQSDASGNVRLMAGAYDPPVQDPAPVAAHAGTENPIDVPASPADGSQQAPMVGGTTATALTAPAWGTAGPQTIRTALAELGALLGRGASALPRISPASLALSFLVPTNTPSESIDLGNGLRARIRPGQRTVEIERQADGGLFGSGFGAHWETLPINAELNVGDDGAASVLIDPRQLENAVGPEAAAQALDAVGSAMARPPRKNTDASLPPADTRTKSDQTPDPGRDRKPPNWANAAISIGELAARILEQVNRPRPEAEVQTEIEQGCRSVMRARGEQTPDKHYRGKDGYEISTGMRMHPLLPDPTPGRDFSPKDPNHLKGYIGEAELANLVQARGNHFVVHFGNAPGVQGPDVLSIGPDGRFMVWDSKARSAERSVGPSMAAAVSLDLTQLRAYVAREIKSGRLPPELGYHAMKEFEKYGNYNVCTVGTANAHNGYVETVRGRKASGPRRP
jgi:hypothetical protein